MKNITLFGLIAASLCCMLLCGCVARRSEEGLPDGITSPTDIYKPAKNNNPDNINEEQLPGENTTPDDTALDSAVIPFSYKAYYEISPEELASSKEWMDSLGGLPGFTASASFDPKLCNYVITGEMGGQEAIDYMEITERSVRVVFREGIKLHRFMHECPGGVMMNSFKTQATSDDGKTYTSTAYKYTACNGTTQDAENGERAYLLINFETPIAEPIVDLYIYWGSVD